MIEKEGKNSRKKRKVRNVHGKSYPKSPNFPSFRGQIGAQRLSFRQFGAAVENGR
jgi:hypothetical protein